MDNHDAWVRLGKLLVARRVDLGFPKRVDWLRELGVKHPRTIEDLENGRRDNYNPSTLASVEKWYQWATGSIDDVLAGGEPRNVFSGEHPVLETLLQRLVNHDRTIRDKVLESDDSRAVIKNVIDLVRGLTYVIDVANLAMSLDTPRADVGDLIRGALGVYVGSGAMALMQRTDNDMSVEILRRIAEAGEQNKGRPQTEGLIQLATSPEFADFFRGEQEDGKSVSERFDAISESRPYGKESVVRPSAPTEVDGKDL